MRRLVAVLVTLLLFCGFCVAQSFSTYQGSTGKKKAVFVLTWHTTNKKVSGYYYTTDRPSRRYDLAGQNYSDGRLVLKEFTDGETSAVIRLTKTRQKGQVRWSGTMYNTDGRRIPVTMTRL